MRTPKLCWDVWKGDVYDEHEIEAPEWAQVEAVIRALDGERRTLVSLESDGDHQLLVGGGSGQYILTVLFDDENHVSARDETRSGNKIELTIGGQTGIYDSELVWDLGTLNRP